jgi:hypothetical protein
VPRVMQAAAQVETSTGMKNQQQAEQEQRHKDVVLADHDVLLFPYLQLQASPEPRGGM